MNKIILCKTSKIFTNRRDRKYVFMANSKFRHIRTFLKVCLQIRFHSIEKCISYKFSIDEFAQKLPAGTVFLLSPGTLGDWKFLQYNIPWRQNARATIPEKYIIFSFSFSQIIWMLLKRNCCLNWKMVISM